MATRLRHVARLLDTLRDLDTNLVNKSLRKALRAGAKIQQKAVKSRARKRTGALRKSVKVRSARRKKNHVGVVVVVTGGHPTPMVAAEEYGTAHQAPHPFIRPGFSASVRPATDAVAAVLRDAIRSTTKKTR